MAKWQGTKIPNTGYVEKIYLNTALNADEVVSLVENAGLNYFDYQGVLRLNFILAKADETFSLAIFKTSDTDFAIVDLASNYIYFVYVIDPDDENVDVDFIGWNPDFNGIIEINSEVINNVPNEDIAVGIENDKLTSLFSVTPFIKGEETTADKLQKLIDGKQYVIDKVNAKANSNLEINSTWKIVGDTVENIQSGEENTLKKLLDYTKSCSNMFSNNTTITDLTGIIGYSDTSNVTNMAYMFNSCSALTTIPQFDTSNVTNMSSMFSTCRNLTTIPQLDTSKVTNMSSMFYMGQYDTSNKLMTIPQLDTSNVTNMNSMFYACGKLQRIEFSSYNVGALNSSGFCNKCYSLKTFIIRSFGSNYSINSNVFTGCYHILGTVNATYNPEGLKDGYIYVPRDMVDTLKSATNWSVYADQIRALEDYTVDGTITGELDESKI